MSEVSVRLSELRHASERLRQSAYRLQMSVDHVIPIIDQSLLDALPLSENVALYQAHKANISALPAQVTRFADNLEHAATDIESAIDNQSCAVGVVHFYAPKRVKLGNSSGAIALTSTGNSHTSPIQKMTLDDYVSRRNQPLYDELKVKQIQLKDRTNALTLLMTQRNMVAEDLTALKNRMMSYEVTVNIDNQPRTVAMQTQIDDLDMQIQGIREEVSNLQTQTDDLMQRLDRVSPAAGAELDAIVRLEGADNPLWMKTSTFGCVNHVVDKMPLPNGVPRDALLWDDAAMQLPQYGISWGDTPLEGSVLQLDPSHPYADDQYGHVLYVERVDGMDVWVTDNMHPDEPVKLSDLTAQLTGEDMRYLYFPWHTRA